MSAGKATAAGAGILLALALLAALLGSPLARDALCRAVLAGGAPPVQLSGEQLTNAAAIIQTGKDRRLPQRAWTIALATALQESSLHNLSQGDRDSLGLFQQRPSQGWGNPAELMDPATAAGKFYDRLIAIPDWQHLPLTTVAQTVQASAYPYAYARHEPLALAIIATVAGLVCSGPGQALFAGITAGERAVNAALAQLGVPYSWGGGNYHGPTRGICLGGGFLGGRCVAATTTGFDCSGLAAYAWYQATGGRARLGRHTSIQATQGRPVPREQLQSGDLLFFSAPGNPLHHVGLYAGNGRMLHAPRTGKPIQITENVFTDPYWGQQYAGAVRPTT